MYWLYAVYTMTILPAFSCHSLPSFILFNVYNGVISYLVRLTSLAFNSYSFMYVLSLHNVCLMTLMLQSIHAYDVRSASSSEDHAARVMPQLCFRIGRI